MSKRVGDDLVCCYWPQGRCTKGAGGGFAHRDGDATPCQYGAECRFEQKKRTRVPRVRSRRLVRSAGAAHELTNGQGAPSPGSPRKGWEEGGTREQGHHGAPAGERQGVQARGGPRGGRAATKKGGTKAPNEGRGAQVRPTGGREGRRRLG